MDQALFRQLFVQALEREVSLIRTACAGYTNLQSQDFLACVAVAHDMDDAYEQWLENVRPVARKMGVDLNDCRSPPPQLFSCLFQ